MLYNRVIVPDYVCANILYWELGYYGTFLGVAKPKEKSIRSPLELSMLEALYLAENGVLEIYSGARKLSIEEIKDFSIRAIPRFHRLYVVYKDLRRRGFVVRRGLKFGCDYLVYRFGPGIDHAPYGVHVYDSRESIDPIEIVRMGRLLHSVRKKLILAVTGEENIRYLLFTWWKP